MDVTGHDFYIICKALAYAIECINRLPKEWQEASDQSDMEKLLTAMCDENAGVSSRRCARAYRKARHGGERWKVGSRAAR